MVLADEGSFFVRGHNERSEFADLRGPTPVAGTIRTGQMYVQFRIPVKSNGVPVVMVHGANHSGVTYETTPDGREGWAKYFVRTGFPAYVVDQAGRGRSGFNPTGINRAKAKGDTSKMPTITIAHSRGRLGELSARSEISGVLAGLALSAGRARPLFLAGRANGQTVRCREQSASRRC